MSHQRQGKEDSGKDGEMHIDSGLVLNMEAVGEKTINHVDYTKRYRGKLLPNKHTE